MWSSEEVLSISTRGTPFDSGCRWYRADCKTKEMYWTAIFRCEPFSNSFFVTLSFNLGFRMFWLLSALCGWMTLRTRVSPISTVRQRADDKIWFATSFCSGWYSTYSYANYQLGKKQHGLIGRCCLWRLYKAALVLVFFLFRRKGAVGQEMRNRAEHAPPAPPPFCAFDRFNVSSLFDPAAFSILCCAVNISRVCGRKPLSRWPETISSFQKKKEKEKRDKPEEERSRAETKAKGKLNKTERAYIVNCLMNT